MKQGVLTCKINDASFTATAHYQDKLLSVSVAKFGAFFQTNRVIFDEEEDDLHAIANKLAIRFYDNLTETTAPTAVQENTPMMDLINLILEENERF